MASFYELALMGSASDDRIRELELHLSQCLDPFGLRLGTEVAWTSRTTSFTPNQQTAAAVVFYGAEDASDEGLTSVLRAGIPVIPVVTSHARVTAEIPETLRTLNCLAHQDGGTRRIATALLECVGLLPRQRRIFVSYRRNEAREAALQLFDTLSSRQFDVFLDTHGIAPAEDFQPMLWHRLCDSDVLVMLDTPGYFESRWTSAEFGRALAKGISVLRIGWPNAALSARISTASRLDMVDGDIDVSGQFSDTVMQRICFQIETLRSQSHAVRGLSLFSRISQGISQIGGSVTGVGKHRAIFASLPGGKDIAIYPTVGVPTSLSLHEAATSSPSSPVAVVYDEVGLHPDWLEHLSWLGTHIRVARYIKAHEVAWAMADWDA